MFSCTLSIVSFESKIVGGSVPKEWAMSRKAISYFEKIIETTKELDERILYRSYYNLGNCYKWIENYNSARKAYDAAENTDDDRLLARIEEARKDLPGE